MFKIVCPNCQADNKFQSRTNVPVECSFCWGEIPENIAILGDSQTREITGLTIIYQITQQRIEIPTLHKIVLGRENFGANIFSQILFNGKPVVSRKHCSIEFKNNSFHLLDEGSLNGTYYGVNKLSCKNFPQVIEDKSIFYIGEEAFIAQINYKEVKIEDDVKEIDSNPDSIQKVKSYKCKKCGTKSEVLLEKCSGCGFKYTLIEIYVTENEKEAEQKNEPVIQSNSPVENNTPLKSELQTAIEQLTFDFCIIDTNIWMETKKTKLYHGRIGTLKILYKKLSKFIVAHGSTYEELKKFADSGLQNDRTTAAASALRMIKNLHKEKILSIPGLKAEHDKTAYADKDIYTYASDEYQTGKSILFITNDNDCNIRVNSSLSDLKRKNNSLPKYEVMDMEQFAKYVDIIHKNF